MQKLPIACRPLADWQGQTVRFEGYLNHWKTIDKTGDTACLLRNVKVVLYRGSENQVRTLDHLWIYLSKDIRSTTNLMRLGGYSAVGKVVSYTRSNRTKDYAIDIKEYVPIQSRISLLKLPSKPTFEDIKIRTELLKDTLHLLEIEELNFGIRLSYEAIYETFRKEYEFCNAQVEINERYQAKQQYRSRPNTNVVKFSATASKSTKVAGRGFATVG